MPFSRGFGVAFLIAGAAACGGLIDTSDGSGGGDGATTPRSPHGPTDAGVSTGPGGYGEAGSEPPPPNDGDDASTPRVDAGIASGGADAGTTPDAGATSAGGLATGLPLHLAVDSTRLYWTDDQSPGLVRSLDKATGTVTTLATSTQGFGLGPNGIAVDATSVYWTEWGPIPNVASGSVRSVPIGGGATTVLVDSQNGAVGIAVDATSIYWTNGAGGSVMKADKDGSHARTIATGQDLPVSIKVVGSALVWLNRDWPETSSIVTSGLEGENPIVLRPNSETNLTHSVATDGTTAFFVESIGNSGYLRSIALSGGASSLLATGDATNAYEAPIALDANFIWASWAGEGLVKIPRAGGAAIALLPPGDPSSAVDLVLDDTSVYWINVSNGQPPSVIKTMPK